MQRWAWEFLRRNPDYQADYAVQAAIPNDGDPENAEKVLAIRAKYHVGKMPDPASEYSPKVRRALKFTAFQGPSYLPYLPNAKKQGCLPVTQPGDISVKFNVSLSINIQLERAEIILKRFQRINEEQSWIEAKQKRRPGPEHLQRFLQILDGVRVGVPVREIAARLLPDDDDRAPDYPRRKIIRGNLQSARKLSQEGYVFLVYLEKPEILRKTN